MPNKSDHFRAEVGKRLAKLRKMRGFEKQRHFAAYLDIPEDTYTKWEKGRALIPPYYVLDLKKQFGISADWLYFGDEASLPVAVFTELQKVS